MQDQTVEIKCFQGYENVDYGPDYDQSPVFTNLSEEKFQLIVYSYDEGYKKIAYICEAKTKGVVVGAARKNGHTVTSADMKNVTVLKGDLRSMR